MQVHAGKHIGTTISNQLTQRIAQPVGINARTLANKSVIERSVSATKRTIAAISAKAMTPCMNLIISWKFVDFFGLEVKTCEIIQTNISMSGIEECLGENF